MTIVQLDFTFDFPQGAKKHSHEIDLESPTLDGLERGVKAIIQRRGTDFTNAEAVESLGWELENYLQSEGIIPRLQCSNFALQEEDDELHFLVELELWGKHFKSEDRLYDVEEEYELTSDSTEEDFNDAVYEAYTSSHHEFDIHELRLSVR